MAKKPKRKKRNEHIYATTKGSVSEIEISFDSRTGEIRFGPDMTNVYSEVTYDRAKGPKVLSRIPQAQPDLSFDAPPALEKNFDYLCAVDTNTRRIQGKNVSAVGIVTFEPVWAGQKNGLQRAWRFDVPFGLEYVEIKTKPENCGWLEALAYLHKFGHIDPSQRIGVVVDSDLGNLSDYNERKKPVDGPHHLPANVTLLYASADAGQENILNKALSLADSVASQTLEALVSGKVAFNKKPVQSDFYEGIRIIRPTLVRH